jgi:hypothetical protein
MTWSQSVNCRSTNADATQRLQAQRHWEQATASPRPSYSSESSATPFLPPQPTHVGPASHFPTGQPQQTAIPQQSHFARVPEYYGNAGEQKISNKLYYLEHAHLGQSGEHHFISGVQYNETPGYFRISAGTGFLMRLCPEFRRTVFVNLESAADRYYLLDEPTTRRHARRYVRSSLGGYFAVHHDDCDLVGWRNADAHRRHYYQQQARKEAADADAHRQHYYQQHQVQKER